MKYFFINTPFEFQIFDNDTKYKFRILKNKEIIEKDAYKYLLIFFKKCVAFGSFQKKEYNNYGA